MKPIGYLITGAVLVVLGLVWDAIADPSFRTDVAVVLLIVWGVVFAVQGVVRWIDR